MKTQVRDDAISKNKKMLRVLTATCLAQTVAIVALSGLTLYAFLAREVVYIPSSGGQPYSLSQLSMSPTYLTRMATDVMQQRLTWNVKTVVDQYQNLLSMVEPTALDSIRKQLNDEIKVVKSRHMSSVFYQDEKSTLVDPKAKLVQVSGKLQRIDDGVVLPSVTKTYQIKFNAVLGTLHLVSIDEVKHHA